MQLLITNAKVVSDGKTVESDVLVANGRIERIDSGLSVKPPVKVIDAAGRYLLPGMIDDQVHFREPGLTQKGNMATESAAAVAGGITSFMDMPNVNPMTTTREALAAKYELAAGRCHANYSFYLGATNHNIEEIKALQIGEACGIKAFMGASTGNLLVDDTDALERIFEHAPVLVVTHCEDSPIIWANEAAAKSRYGDAIPMTEHPAIRSAESCLKSSSLAVNLARRHDAKLHVLHLTTAKEMHLFSTAPRDEKRITAEVCVHHLWFDASDYPRLGNRIKCNPAIKYAEDRAALHAALKAGNLDIIATDHAPHTRAEKQNSSYFKAPAGLPLVQHALVSLLEFVRQGEYSLEFIADKTAHAVADIYGVDNRGYIREGYHADLVLIDMDKPWTVSPDNVRYKCAWSPFEGVEFGASIDTTIVNGQIAYENGQLSDGAFGERLKMTGSR
ncbi:MAG: dihydroorotase [Pseudomonadota bacterium]